MPHTKSKSHKRFSERAGHLIRGRSDFAVRRRITDAQVFSLICALFIVVAGVGFMMFNEMMSSSEKAIVGTQVCTLMGLIMYILSRKYKALHDTLQATEFMTTAFVSGLSLQCKFYLLATPDGEVIYLDRVFQDLFPDLAEQDDWNLPELFSLYHVPDEDRRKILQSVSESKKDTIDITIGVGPYKQAQSVQLSIEPLSRPKGILLLCGK